MTVIKVCPTCFRGYPDVSLNYCIDDGSELSEPLTVSTGADEQEVQTVIRIPGVSTRTAEPPRRIARNEYKKETDPFIAAAVGKHRSLAFHVNSGNEHCVELVGRENQGSLWVRHRPRRNDYRLQTTGQAQRLDKYIEELCGPAVGSAKPQVYQHWYVSAANLEKVMDRFATLI
jgi:hypothetical protein